MISHFIEMTGFARSVLSGRFLEVIYFNSTIDWDVSGSAFAVPNRFSSPISWGQIANRRNDCILSKDPVAAAMEGIALKSLEAGLVRRVIIDRLLNALGTSNSFP